MNLNDLELGFYPILVEIYHEQGRLLVLEKTQTEVRKLEKKSVSDEYYFAPRYVYEKIMKIGNKLEINL